MQASRVKAAAVASLLAWVAASLLLTPEALRLGDRLVYSEEYLVPEGLESYEAARILERLNLSTGGSYLIAVYKPVTPEASRLVESRVREALAPWDPHVVGPWSVYERILGAAVEKLGSVLANASEAYVGLERLAATVAGAYVNLTRALNLTYGVARAYGEAYNLAVAVGVSDPAGFAYGALREALPAEAQPFLDEFYKAILNLTGGRPEAWALEAAAREAAARLFQPELAALIDRFGLGNYTDASSVEAVLYEALRGRGVNLTLEEFRLILRDPVRAPAEIVGARLSSVAPCMPQALQLSLKGVPPADAAREACTGYLEQAIPFPDGIPAGVRERFTSGGYGFVYAYTRAPVEVNESISVMDHLREPLDGVEVYYYGSIPLFAELAVNAERETSRIDVVTAALVTVLLVLLLGSLSAPAMILAGASAALAVSMGLLSVAAEHVGIHYLARIVVIPLIFGVTVDYSVFYLFRVVEEYTAAGSWESAVAAAWRRAGRALTLGGVAVVLGFVAYTLTPQAALRGIGVALVIASAVSFLSSLTLLPAIIALAGPRGAFWPRRSPGMPAAGQARVFRRLAAASVRHGATLTLAMLALTGALAFILAGTPPSANIHFSFPPNSQFIEAARILYSTLPPQYYSTLTIIAPRGAGDITGILESHGLKVERVEEAGGYTVVTAGLPFDPLDDRVFGLLESLRAALPPGVLVGGFPALRVDAVDSILGDFTRYTLPLASALILGYLMAGYGSVLVPLRLLATVAFSVAASLTIATYAFTPTADAVSAYSYMRSPMYWLVPIIVAGLMITLGMDYDIFLTTRVREELEHGRQQDQAILEAVEKTGVVITVCGVILAGAFSTLLLTSIPTLREAGLAVALSIMIDTFLVRPVLVPAVMTTLGGYNWWPGKSIIKRWD